MTRATVFAFLLLAQAASAQQNGPTIITTTLPPIEGQQQGVVPSLADDGLRDDTGVILQLTPGGQDGVLLESIPNPRASAVTSVTEREAGTGTGAILRALDKTLGRPTDIELLSGQTVLFGRIAIRLLECRYPMDDPSSDAYAHLQILDTAGIELFDGWMIASSPALMALEHPRYDVWVLRCSSS